jgi:hypothetical protein
LEPKIDGGNKNLLLISLVLLALGLFFVISIFRGRLALLSADGLVVVRLAHAIAPGALAVAVASVQLAPASIRPLDSFLLGLLVFRFRIGLEVGSAQSALADQMRTARGRAVSLLGPDGFVVFIVAATCLAVALLLLALEVFLQLAAPEVVDRRQERQDVSHAQAIPPSD